MERYSNKFVAIHWIHGLLLGFILIGAKLNIPKLTNTPQNLESYKMHMVMGLIAFALLIVRLILLRREPKLKIYKDNFKQALVDWNHRLIYLFIFLSAISGMAIAKVSNLGEILFLKANPNSFSGLTPLVKNFATMHSIFTTILMALIAMHVIGVVVYIIKTKENIIKKMWFS